MIRKLSGEEALALLREKHLARLGCVSDGGPYVVPVNYACDDVSIIVHSLPGRKIDAMRADPRVCVQADEIKDQFNWSSVIAFGRYEEIARGAARELALERLLAAFPALTPVESVGARDGREPVVFRVLIERVTGVREG